ncbi:MAG TPA: hypothetical protein VFX50_12690 [Gemmatimonadales bacterium]|nr:hypothetical protein [Gemmatimonadales bacterium]
MKRPPSPSDPRFVEVRDPRTLKVVCRYNPHTHEVEVRRGDDVRRAALPQPTREPPRPS